METNKTHKTENHNGWVAFRLMTLAGEILGNVVLGFDETTDAQGYGAVKAWLDEHRQEIDARSGLIDGGVLADHLRPPLDYVGRILNDDETREVLDIFTAQTRSAEMGAN